MNQRRVLLILVLAVLLGGLAAWLILDPAAGLNPRGASGATQDRPRPGNAGAHANDLAATDPGQDTPGRASPGAARESADPEIVRPDPARPPGTQGDQPQGSPTGQSTSPGPGGTNPPAAQGNPDRPLTAREQAELARRNGGRAAHNTRVTSTPENGTSNTRGLVRSLDPQQWQQSFAEEGLEPPEMVATPVAGKVMSPLSNEGIANAKISMLSFLPWSGRHAGPLYVVATELVANAKGEFTGTIPVAPRGPLYHPPVGMIVEAAGEIGGDLRVFQVVAGMPIETLRPGEFNQLGIFWAPEEPFDVNCDATQFSENGLKVVCTGELDPQRWHESRRSQALALFAATPVKPRNGETPEPLAGCCTLRGTWDTRDAPWLTLCKGTEPLVTRRCVRRKQQSNKSGDATQIAQPFEDVVFENTGYVRITGQVVDPDGAGVAGAAVLALGDPTLTSSLTDAAGWFEIANPGPKTSFLVATHDDFVSAVQWGVKPGDSGVQVRFSDRKPVLWLRLRDRYTQAPISQVSLKAIEKVLPPQDGGKPPAPRTQTFELSSAGGEYVQKIEWLVNSIVLEKVGYFPRTINDPMTAQAAASGPLDIDLYPGRELNIRPRDYTAVQDAERWFPDSKPEDPGIYTAWSNHWIEWSVDFGPAPEPGVEGGSFDILLGCTNQGLVDNQYRFDVEVWVDGTKKGNLSILANSTAVQTGRMKLGKLSGTHTVRLVWLNDKWIPDQLDANIRYASLQFLEQP